MFFRSLSANRRLVSFAIPVMALLFGGCKGMRDKIDEKLYAKADDGGWIRDSTLIVSKPQVLFMVTEKGSSQYVFPIAQLTSSGPQTLRLATKRGWGFFDINMLFEGKPITPIRESTLLEPTKSLRGMWEVPSVPLDTNPTCTGAMLPMGLVSFPAGTKLAVANYKGSSGARALSGGELESAIRDVPLLVMPTIQISASQLDRYTRKVQQIPRVNADPAIMIEYHDDSPVADTGVVGVRRPRHVLMVLEKGIYNYRPTWIYKTTGGKGDMPILRTLDVIDTDGDGRGEIIARWNVLPTRFFLMAYKESNGTWQEFWRRSDARCDQG